MLKIISFLVLLFSFSSSEVLQYCSNSAQGCLGGDYWHYGQVMTPSVNKGLIQWVSVYTNQSHAGSVTGRYHHIELWGYNGETPFWKFYDAQVFVPIGFVGWWQTFVNQYWDGGSEEHFVAVFQQEFTYYNPYNWSRSQIGYDGMQNPSEIERNWQAGNDGIWSLFPGNLGNLMFKVGFLPGGPGVVPASLGMVKSNFQ